MEIKVPWSKLYFDQDEIDGVLEVMKSGWVSTGPKVKELEDRLADYVGVKYAVAVSSGTAALDIALKILGVTSGDEVIVPAMTYIATVHAVEYQHATPVFADIDPRTFTIDLDDVKRKITPKTKCIIPVDYAGQGPDYDRLKEIADKHGLFVVEDGAPGLCGTYKGKKLCSMGDISITSFHVAKIFTTVEGGMLFTDDKSYYEKARIIRWQGESPDQKYFHPMVGFNFRMTDLNAVIGLAQTSPERMKKVLESRGQAAQYYLERLKDVDGLTIPHIAPENQSAWFLFPVLVSVRDQIRDYLERKGIKVNISWPMPVYEQEAYQKYKKDICPVAELVTREVLCLPLFYKISREEQDYVLEHLIKAVEKFSGREERSFAGETTAT